MIKKEILTSHELGFYRDLAVEDPYHTTKKPDTTTASDYNSNRDYLYLFLRKVSVRGVVSLTQKEIAKKLDISVQTVRRGQQRLERLGLLVKEKKFNPSTKQPNIFKIKKTT